MEDMLKEKEKEVLERIGRVVDELYVCGRFGDKKLGEGFLYWELSKEVGIFVYGVREVLLRAEMLGELWGYGLELMRVGGKFDRVRKLGAMKNSNNNNKKEGKAMSKSEKMKWYQRVGETQVACIKRCLGSHDEQSARGVIVATGIASGSVYAALGNMLANGEVSRVPRKSMRGNPSRYTLIAEGNLKQKTGEDVGDVKENGEFLVCSNGKLNSKLAEDVLCGEEMVVKQKEEKAESTQAEIGDCPVGPIAMIGKTESGPVGVGVRVESMDDLKVFTVLPQEEERDCNECTGCEETGDSLPTEESMTEKADGNKLAEESRAGQEVEAATSENAMLVLLRKREQELKEELVDVRDAIALREKADELGEAYLRVQKALKEKLGRINFSKGEKG